MDESASDKHRNALRDREPEWLGRPRPGAPSPYRRPFWPQFESSSEPTSWLVGALLIVAFCITVMAVAGPILRQWRPSTVTPDVTAPMPRAVGVPAPAAASAASAAPVSLGSLEDFDRRNRETAQREADQRREAANKQRLAEEETARVAIDTELRREREWQAYYKKPSWCDDRLRDIDSVGCANDYIRARRAFDERFVAANRR
jgi:hypothetical protein